MVNVDAFRLKFEAEIYACLLWRDDGIGQSVKIGRKRAINKSFDYNFTVPIYFEDSHE